MKAVDLEQWLAEHRQHFKPPVSNAIVWPNQDLLVQMVGGPNFRADFHDDPYAELFIQLKGDIHLRIVEQGRLREVPIRAGELYLCPAHVRHCAQRPAGTFGLVVEVQRKGDEIDAFEWYCPNCANRLQRMEITLRAAELDAGLVSAVFEAFYEDVKRRTCSACGTIHPRP